MESDKKKIARKDIIIILISLAALLALLGLFMYSRNSRQEAAVNPVGNGEQDMQRDENTKVKNTADNDIEIKMKDRQILLVTLKGSANLVVKDYSVSVNGELTKFPEDITRLKPEKEIEIALEKELETDRDNVVSVCDKEGSIRASVLVPSEEVKKSNKCIFSLSGGFYPEDTRVEIHAPEDWDIYYTTDGTTPTEESSKYLGSVPISSRTGNNLTLTKGTMGESFKPATQIKGTFLRALAVSPDGKEKCRMSQTYFVGVGQESAIRDLPVLSIGSDPEGLVSYENGIYVAGRHYEDAVARQEDVNGKGNYYDDVSRDAYAEFFEPGKDKTWEGSVKLSTLKDEYVNLNQRGLVLDHLSRKVTKGSSLFPYTDSKKICLYNGGTDHMYKIREMLAADLVEETPVGSADYKLCSVFINGEYWGLYMLRTPCDASMIRRKYGIKDKTKILVSGNGEGASEDFSDLVSYVEETDLSVEGNYKKVTERMDVDSYIYYICVNMFLANYDHGKESPTIWRTEGGSGSGKEDSRWRWILGKMQNTMDNGYLGQFSTATIDTFFQPGVTEDPFLQSLLKSPAFRSGLKKTMKELCGQLTAEHVEKILEDYTEQYGKAVRANYLRFSGAAADKFYQSEAGKIEAFFGRRAEYIMKYTLETVGEKTE